MEELVEEFLKQKSAEGLANTTINVNRRIMRLLIRHLRERGIRKATQVRPQDLDEYMYWQLESGIRFRTRSRRAQTYSVFFRWLTENGRLLSNPARNLAMPADEDEEPLLCPPLSEAAVGEILDNFPRRSVIDLRNKLQIELLYGCGLRIGESIALDVKDCDLDSRTVRVRLGKWRKGRVLPMMRGVYAALRDYLALRRSLLKGPDSGALLLSYTGRRIDQQPIRKWMQKYNKNGKPGQPHIYPHLFRHSIAVHLLRGGADIRHVQEFLGHSDLDTTKTYLRLVPGRLKEDYDKAFPEIAVKA